MFYFEETTRVSWRSFATWMTTLSEGTAVLAGLRIRTIFLGALGTGICAGESVGDWTGVVSVEDFLRRMTTFLAGEAGEAVGAGAETEGSEGGRNPLETASEISLCVR